MRTRWPPRWQFITKNMRTSSLRLANSSYLHTKCLILLILELQTLSLSHPNEAIRVSFRILYIQDGIQDGSRQVLQTLGSSHLPVGMSDG